MKLMNVKVDHEPTGNSVFDSIISQAKKGAVFFDWYQTEKEVNGSVRSVDVVIQRV